MLWVMARVYSNRVIGGLCVSFCVHFLGLSWAVEYPVRFRLTYQMDGLCI